MERGRAESNPAGWQNHTEESVFLSGTAYLQSLWKLYVGEQKITIHSIQDYVLLNCETHNAYNASGFCNETILSDDFPELPEGKTQITWTGGIQTVEVIPRWWTL